MISPGASLASFADQQAAEELAILHKDAQVVTFDQIDQEFLQQAVAAQHGGIGHDMHQPTDSHDSHSGH